MNYEGRVIKGDVDTELLNVLARDRLVACDIETSGLDFIEDDIGTVQLSSRAAGSFVVKVDSRVPPILRSLMEDENVTKVFHHASFDVRFLVSKWSISPRNVADTKIASKLLRPGAPAGAHSLKPLLRSYLGVDIDKAQQVSDWTALDLTAEQVSYALNDVRHLLPLYEVLCEDVEKQGLATIYDECLRFLPVRAVLDVGGWPDVFQY